MAEGEASGTEGFAGLSELGFEPRANDAIDWEAVPPQLRWIAARTQLDEGFVRKEKPDFYEKYRSAITSDASLQEKSQWSLLLHTMLTALAKEGRIPPLGELRNKAEDIGKRPPSLIPPIIHQYITDPHGNLPRPPGFPGKT